MTKASGRAVTVAEAWDIMAPELGAEYIERLKVNPDALSDEELLTLLDWLAEQKPRAH
jgi:hypothetical protein